MEKSRSIRRAGKYIEDFLEEYVVLDLETTGLSPVTHEIIEIGAIAFRGGVKTGEYCTLVRPKTRISGFITNLTGISNDMVRFSPTIEEALPGLHGFLDGRPVLAHNASFDLGFLNAAYERHFGMPFPNDYLDTMRISRKLYPTARHRLQDLTERFGIERDGAHRSMADCIMTQRAYECMREHCRRNGIELKNKPKPNRFGSGLNLKELKRPENEVDKNHPLYGRCICITGALLRETRQELLQKVVNVGGVAVDSVTKKTEILVLGSKEEWTARKSSKVLKAEKMMSEGHPIRIMSEEELYRFL